MSRYDDVSPAKATVILDKPSDWDEWFFILKDKAVDLDIWQYINPEPTLDEAGQPQSLPTPPSKPIIPRVKDVKADAETVRDLDPDDIQALKALQATYKDDEKAYREYLKGRKDINDLIMRTVSLSNHIYMRNSDGVRQKILDLKKHLAPTDEARELELATLYSELKKAPSNQDIGQWLRRWETTYADAVAIKLPDVQGKRSIYDFLSAVQSLDAGFASTQRALIYSKLKTPTLYDVIEEFRNTRRLTAARQRAETHSAFATFKGLDDGSTANNSATDITSNGDGTSPSSDSVSIANTENRTLCICGKLHSFKRCYYLNEQIRPQGWFPRDDIQRKIQEMLAQDKNLAAKIERIHA